MSCIQPRLQVVRSLSFILLLLLASCSEESEVSTPPVRMVKTVTVTPQQASAAVTFTGHIEAQDQAALAFRIAGRITDRFVGLGATVREGDTVAKLNAEDELNQLRSARAALAAAQSDHRKAENRVGRLRHLLERDVASQADMETAEQALTAAASHVEAAAARVRTAEEFVGFTVLKADAPGTVTRVGAEPGEVVSPGRMVIQLARRDGRDAIFEVAEEHIGQMAPNAKVAVTLAGDTAVRASGRVREVAPSADPVTRTFRVTVGLNDPPPNFRLGTTVSGTIRADDKPALAIPATALSRQVAGAGVWLVDPRSLTVSLRKVDVLAENPATAFIGSGLQGGDVVVAAGVGLLKEGQKVRLAGTEAR